MTSRSLKNREKDVPYRGFSGPGNRAEDVDAISGRALEGVFDFGDLGKPLIVKVAVSSVSEDNAVANLDKDGAGFDFDARRAEARQAWEKALSTVDVQAPAETRRTFYTALYHAMDGLEVLTQLRSEDRWKRLPVVILSSSREESDLARSWDLGVNAYVLKPVDVQQFFTAVQTLGHFWAVLNQRPEGD